MSSQIWWCTESPDYDDGVTWFVDVGDATGNLASGLLQPGASTGSLTRTNISVVAGDRVHFIVGRSGNSLEKSWFDTTDLKAVIEYTDTPAAIVATPSAAFPLTYNSSTNEWTCVYQANGSPNNLARDGNYELLSQRTTSFFGLTNVVGWTDSGGLPAVMINTNYTVTIGASGLKLEAFELLLHPAPNQLVGIQWLAPQSGRVSIQFQFDDLDWGGGDGVDWYLQQPRLGQELARGSVHLSSSGRRPTTIDVIAGEKLCFLVSPKGADHTYDSTKLWAHIQYQEPLTVALAVSNETVQVARVTWGFPGDQQLFRSGDVNGPWYTIADTKIGLSGTMALNYCFEELPCGRGAFFKLNYAGTERPKLSMDGTLFSANFLEGIPPNFLNVQVGDVTFAEWKTNALLTTSSTPLDTNRTAVVYVWNDPSGLEISCEALCYADFPAVEWLMWVKNNGVSNSPP
ncbi:MAG: hypothetical protein QM813_20855 [Verrucomicrobiota bacterium]